MSRKVVLAVPVDSDDEVRALYQSFLRARAENLSEGSRLRRLRGSGYGTESDDVMVARAEARALVLDRASKALEVEMEADGIEPW